MNNSKKAFFISLLIHASLFAMFIDFEQQKPEKKDHSSQKNLLFRNVVYGDLHAISITIHA